jgi:hypothetical protein
MTHSLAGISEAYWLETPESVRALSKAQQPEILVRDYLVVMLSHKG